MTEPGKQHPRYINRELSWLEFNHRVLNEAIDRGVPLLERLKFISITSSNLDEFFMVRVGGLQQLAARGSKKKDPSGMTPQKQLAEISSRTHDMVRDQYHCYSNSVEPALAQEGITRVIPHSFSEKQLQHVSRIFDEELFPVITPMAVERKKEFPLLANLGLHVAVRLKPEKGDRRSRFAVIPVGLGVNRFLSLPSEEGYSFCLVEDALCAFVERFFPGEDVAEAVPFRITRNADLGVREDSAADLLGEMQQVLDARKQSDCVRLEIGDPVTKTLLGFLKRGLKVDDRDIYRIPGPINLAQFMGLATMDGYDELKCEPWPPQPVPEIDTQKSMFANIASRDLLLYHPYETFEPIVRLIQEAADDPDVLAIKQILYRTSRNSPIITALQKAAENGKYVTAIVELKARFDEERNIGWAKRLEQAGVQVIYGVKTLKTHAKLCIIVRREAQGIMRYLHFGTGNYNERTAELYSDASYLTCDEQLGADASSFFNAITGYSQPQRFAKLEAAPIGLREKMAELVEAEIERRKQGQKGLIMAKLNSLVDPAMIDLLYKASAAGVEVRLNIRGICCLRPAVEGLSENISVVSIVDRFLEHSRIIYFRHGGDDRVFISSADWMPRNLDRRVELLTPVDDPMCQKKLIRILQQYFEDNMKSWRLLPNGLYERLLPPNAHKAFRSQEKLYEMSCKAMKDARQARRTIFEPHKAGDTVT